MGALLLFILLIIAIALTKLQVRFAKRKEGLFIFYTLKSNFGYRNRYVKQITKNK